MGLFLRQNDPRSELQSKIAAELQEKLRSSSEPGTETDVLPTANMDDSKYLENQHQTRVPGVIISLLVLVLIIVVVLFFTIIGR